jgi:hypothetical protein
MNSEITWWQLLIVALSVLAFVGFVTYRWIWYVTRQPAETIIVSKILVSQDNVSETGIHETLRKEGVRWPRSMTRKLLDELAVRQDVLRVLNLDGTNFYRHPRFDPN